MRWVVSAKAVVFDEQSRVLLGLNDRDEWELPGGQLEAGEAPEAAVRREVLEETGLEIEVVSLLRAWVFHPVPAADVLVVSFGCDLRGGTLRVSDEHRSVCFQPHHQLDRIALPAGYRADIARWAATR